MIIPITRRISEAPKKIYDRATSATRGELEVHLAAENDRLERARAASKIEGIKKEVRDRYLAFADDIAGIRDATEAAAAIVPEAHEVNESLGVIATEVAKEIDGLSVELDRRIEAARAGKAAPELPQSLTRSLEYHPAK